MQSNKDFMQRFSKLNRFIRVVALCRRFIHNCRQPKADRQTTPFTTQELYLALICCVKLLQHISYAPEIENLTRGQAISTSSTLKALHPFIHHEGILRVGGRLQQSTLPYQS
jgi:hypothetical protein